MKTDNPYTFVKQLGLIQRQAGVDPEVVELVCAYGRLLTDAGREVVFYDEKKSDGLRHPQFLHEWLIEKNPQADARFLSFLIRYIHAMAGRKLPVILSTAHFARKRHLSEKYLQWMAFHQDRFYRRFTIPKENGRERELAAPEGQLLTLQRWILRHILERGRLHPAAKAFVRGGSILDNAQPHVGRKIVIRMDLMDFFPSITHRQVRKVFEDFGYPYRVAIMLANFCVLDGKLPQGAPTSPALSNLICRKLDRRFAGLARQMKFRYSRYADDLIFSSNNPQVTALIPFFKDIIRAEGFAVNDAKLNIMRPGQRQEATGLVLNQKPNIRREHWRRLRAVAHRLATQGPKAIKLISRKERTTDAVAIFQGHAGFVNMINPSKGAQLLSVLGGRDSC